MVARGSGDKQKGDRTLLLQLAHPQQQQQFDSVPEEMTVGQMLFSFTLIGMTRNGPVNDKKKLK